MSKSRIDNETLDSLLARIDHTLLIQGNEAGAEWLLEDFDAK